MSEFCGPDFMIVLGTRDDIQLIPFTELLPHSFTKSNLEPAIPAGPSVAEEPAHAEAAPATEVVVEEDDDESIEIYDLDVGESEEEGKIWEI
jgi:hypothetical protein